MQQVSSVVLRSLAEALSRVRGLTIHQIADVSPDPELFYDRTRRWMTWRELTDWIRSVDRAFGPVCWRQVGTELHHAPSIPIIHTLARLTLSLKGSYWVANRWLGPSTFPIIQGILEDLGPHQLRQTLILMPKYEPCTEMFEVFGGMLASAPQKVFGLKPAAIQMRIEGHRAVYDLVLPGRIGFWRSLGWRLRGPFSVRPLLEELADQQSELQQTTRTLLNRNSDFENLLEVFPDGVFIHSEGRIVSMNARMRKLLGSDSPESWIGRPVLDLVHPDSREFASRRISRLRSQEVTSTPPAEVGLIQEGSTEPLFTEIVGMVITYQGKPSVMVLARDLTERKKLQEHLLLKDRMSSLGLLAAGVGHEINNPLNYVRLNLELLRERNSGGLSPEDLRLLTEAQTGVDRMQLIVNDLKTFSRGHQDDPLTPVRIDGVLKSALNLARTEIQNRARLTADVTDLPAILAHEARLGQVFLNLLINAAHAIPAGAPEANEIRVTGRLAREDRVVIEVRDTGVGIPEEDRERVFRPFFTTKEIGQGTGLGLSICHSIVEKFGGTISFESEPGRGTVFRLSFPRAPEVLAPVETNVSVSPRRGRLLIVDDNVELLTSLVTVMSPYHETRGTADASEALELLRSDEAVDCILCDLMMPKMNGVQFFERLRDEFPGLDRKVIFMTGGSLTAGTDRLLRTPGVRWIEKPLEIENLRRKVGEVLACSP